ncbi:RNA-binding S4 domain-containing protein [Chryseobacterium sp. D764]|uniref:RNA-binding S4 domain-containing protein n=1 Tax=unclassified Chryseobacterium TaxID=2593645 RepID=UPI0015C21481|nr:MULTISPECIES: S4 domain-containing protein [unclassified Chryseobacterium]QXU48870.1 RNA-binding S4 domain-containing protein [Chryseobacterium sp. D764]CAD0223923.1 Ribosome-associated heat shock protein implicated in the recycling of the 50S subunit (S4 paralog) [Chryseobacterium sp. JV274]
MRIDKFLWSIRFYKTRNIAAEEIKKNRVSIGTSSVKSSKEVKEGDTIKIRKNQIDYKIKVIQLPKSRIGAKLVPLHIQDVTDKEQYELLKLRKMSQDYYRNKGEGRPTKKDRREMDDYVGNDIASDFTDWDDFFGETDNGEENED